jgi:DNA (cytosine-5)-methyltransferase 1
MGNIINTLGLFSGGGGLDLGFAATGFNIVLSSDIDEYSCRTLTMNQGKKEFLNEHPVLCKDIRNICKKTIKAQVPNKKIDFIIGGPPCQAFSVFGKRKGLGDPRGNLVFEYARLIQEIEPEAFLFENVAGLKTIHDGSLYNDLLEVLSIDGKYTISAHEYELAVFGIPQFRQRVFFIGTRSNKKIPHMIATHAPPTSSSSKLKPFNIVASTMAGLPTPITDWKENPFLNGHVGRKHSERIINRYKSLKFGERDPKTRINKLNPDKPSFTIIVGSDKGGGKGHVHPFENREVTPRESARIQTFPDWWEFYGTGRHVIRQVGNAVPPIFAGLLASHVAKHIFNVRTELDLDNLIQILNVDFLINGN